MRSISRWLWIAAVAATVWTSSARAADKLDGIMKKKDLTSEDKARIDQEVEERAQRLAEVAPDAMRDRAEVRARLMDTLAISGASDSASTYYAERCAHHLGVLLLSSSRSAAEDAALVLRVIDRPETAQALVTGLRSPYEAVQYQCAVGIRNLHKTIGGNRQLVTDALRALGDVGTKTNNAMLLRAVYEAIDFARDIPNFPGSDEQASALTQVLKARLGRLDLGSQDEFKDEEAYRAAFDIGRTKTTIEAKRELLAALVDMLEVHARRYGDRETYKDYLPTLRRLVGNLERAIQQIMQSESTNPPSPTLSSVVENRPNASRAREAMQAVNNLRQALKAEPWKIGK